MGEYIFDNIWQPVSLYRLAVLDLARAAVISLIASATMSSNLASRLTGALDKTMSAYSIIGLMLDRKSLQEPSYFYRLKSKAK